MDNEDSQSSSRPHFQVKRGRIDDDHDPDYAAPLDAKRLKLLEDNGFKILNFSFFMVTLSKSLHFYSQK